MDYYKQDIDQGVCPYKIIWKIFPYIKDHIENSQCPRPCSNCMDAFKVLDSRTFHCTCAHMQPWWGKIWLLGWQPQNQHLMALPKFDQSAARLKGTGVV